MPTPNIDVRALNATVQQAITPMFWGVVAAAVVIPVAAAAGEWVAGKIDKNKSGRQK